MSAEAHQFAISLKYHKFWNTWSWRLRFSGLSYLYDAYYLWKFEKNPWDKGDMIQKFCMSWHEMTPLQTWILQIQTTTEKTKLSGYLILGEIKFCYLKNEHFWEKEPKKLKSITILYFMTTFHNVAFKIETSFKLQRCLSPLWKLEKPIIKVKT